MLFLSLGVQAVFDRYDKCIWAMDRGLEVKVESY